MNNSFSEEDVKKVAKGTAITLAGSSLGKGLFFLGQLMIARLLGVEAFGYYAIGLAVVNICGIIARLGLNTGGMRFVSIYKDSNLPKLKGVLLSATWISFINGAFISLILYFFSEWISLNIFHKPELTEALMFFAFSVPFVASLQTVAYLLQGFHTMKYTTYCREIIQPSSNLILFILFFYTGSGVLGAIYAFILSHLMAFAAGYYYLKKLFPSLIKGDIRPEYDLKDLISYSIPLLLMGFLHYWLFWTDTLMLGFLGTAKDVGIYRAASQVPFIMTLFLVAANSIYAPLAADLYQKGDMFRLSNIFKTTTRWVTYMTAPIFLFLVFSSKEIMMLFGKEYVETGYPVLIILSFGQLMNCMTGGVGYTLTMTGKQKVELINSLGLVILNISLNIWLIPKYGAVGAAIASSTSFILINMARMLEIYFMYAMIPFSRKTKEIILPVSLSIILLSIYKGDISSITKSFINIFLIMTTFTVSVFIFKKTDEEKYLINTFRNKIWSIISK